ncbi:hypothetical protein KC878_01160 [Candidatus Saccharibacteria bacterium]|nr:hypothetical protein [Candidatus Saccharibacteria bacterium]MCB9821172.1 hypothetical protein [Candidatus Nomurabacteria bacterium]
MSEYDFFLNPQTQTSPKRSFSPNGQPSMLKRLMVVVGGICLLIVIAWVVFGIVLKPDTGPADRLAEIYSEQADLLDIASGAKSKIRSSESQELLAGSVVLLNSDHFAINSLLEKLGREVTKLELQNAVDQTIRDELNAATSANTYDTSFYELYTNKLLEYRSQLAEAYAGTDSTSQRETINQAYANISILLGYDVAATN